jgi:hypothetical protein
MEEQNRLDERMLEIIKANLQVSILFDFIHSINLDALSESIEKAENPDAPATQILIQTRDFFNSIKQQLQTIE